MEISVADHVHPVQRANFAIGWEQMGEENELEETFALSTVHSLQGSSLFEGHLIWIGVEMSKSFDIAGCKSVTFQ